MVDPAARRGGPNGDATRDGRPRAARRRSRADGRHAAVGGRGARAADRARSTGCCCWSPPTAHGGWVPWPRTSGSTSPTRAASSTDSSVRASSPRTPDRADGRASLVALTPEGEQVLARSTSTGSRPCSTWSGACRAAPAPRALSSSGGRHSDGEVAGTMRGLGRDAREPRLGAGRRRRRPRARGGRAARARGGDRGLRHRQGDRARRLRLGAARSRAPRPRARVTGAGRARACPAATSPRATSSWAWCVGRTPSRAARARTASGTCAATAATPSAASSPSTATPASCGRPDRVRRTGRRALGHAGVLTEPTSVVAKAWEQVDRIGDRAWFAPRHGPRDRRRSHRSARRDDRRAARVSTSTSSTASPTARSRTSSRPGSHLPPRHDRRRRLDSAPGRGHRGHRRRVRGVRRDRRDRVPTASSA